eukprot:m.56687 g.56687  ORF g.56687 m.56687 type:complete len:168 (+) comp12649_c0_seq1:212-715(+)
MRFAVNAGHTINIKCSGKMVDAVTKAFKQFDLDGNGSVDTDELSKILEALGEDNDEARVAAAIAEVDVNEDGKIQLDEFKKFVELVRKGDSKASASDFADIVSTASAKSAIMDKIKENTPEKIKKERVWTPGVDKDGFGKKVTSQTKTRREPPKGGPPPAKSLADLP